MLVQSYLNWLVREQANTLINIFIKQSDKSITGRVLLVSDAVDYISQHSDADAIWASVHCIKDGVADKYKVKQEDISDYRYLAIDVDAKAAHAIKHSATDEERNKTLAVADKIQAMLCEHGLPTPLKVMSGNGALLLFPIDLPCDDDNKALLKRLTAVLGKMYNDADCDIDSTVPIDSARILGVAGTMNRDKSEDPSAGRIAKMRTVIGDYPPNAAMNAGAFIAAVKGIIAQHEQIDALLNDNAIGSVEDMPLAHRDKPRVQQTTTMATTTGWDGIDSPNWVEPCKKYLSKIGDAISGQGGHKKTLQAACICYRFGLSDTDALQVLNWYNDNHCQPCWSDAELRHKLSDAKDKVNGSGQFGDYRREKDKPRETIDYPHTDVGNAENFRDKHKDDLIYITAWASWYVWDGRRWAKDADAKAKRLAIKFVRNTMLDYAKTIKDDDRRTKYLRWAIQSQSESRINAMLSLASSLMAYSHDRLDANGNLFNVRNGTIELDTLKFRPHDRRDLLTKLANVDYDPSATAPTWDRFINRIFQDADGKPRMDYIDYVRRAVGYSLTADVSAQCLFILYGNGRNGKTTFMTALMGMLGDYAMVGQHTLLLRQDGHVSRNNDDDADLVGQRLVSVSEIDDGQRFNEAKIKRLVGGGIIKAMRKFQHPFEFEPTHKLWLDCNHKPKVSGTDEGIWRRIKLIEFLVQISIGERDEHLGDKLRSEASGILNWALDGLKSWVADERRLNEPRGVGNAVNEYRNQSDTFGLFLSDCIQNNDAEKIAVASAYIAYCRWADDNGMTFKLTKVEFGKRMSERGYQQRQQYRVGRCYIGCSLKTDADAPADAVEVDDRPF